MNTKAIATIATFTALTIVLNLSPIKIPAPYAPYLIYQVWEIPIVAAFLLYGITVGVAIALINTAMLFIVFPGTLPTGPLYNLAAVLSMLFGIVLAKAFFKKKLQAERETLLATLSTGFGIIFRVSVMSFVNWAFLRFPPPVGFNMPEAAILVALPLIAFFNATLALYTIPMGYAVAKATKVGVKAI